MGGVSLPARERGLKQKNGVPLYQLTGSLPARERGLKQGEPLARQGAGIVAPRAGAWIETVPTLSWLCVDASLPARERGLKPSPPS